MVHNVFAAVVDGVVMNVFLSEDIFQADWIARMSYGDRESVLAVDVNQYPVQINDIYRGNTFYRVDPETGKEREIEYVPTEEQTIRDLNWTLDVMLGQAIESEYKICQIELSLI